MGFDRTQGEVQVVCDFGVSASPSQKDQYLIFPFGNAIGLQLPHVTKKSLASASGFFCTTTIVFGLII